MVRLYCVSEVNQKRSMSNKENVEAKPWQRAKSKIPALSERNPLRTLASVASNVLDEPGPSGVKAKVPNIEITQPKADRCEYRATPAVVKKEYPRRRLDYLPAPIHESTQTASLPVADTLTTPNSVAPVQSRSEQKKVKRTLKRPLTQDHQQGYSGPLNHEREPETTRSRQIVFEWPPVYAQDYVTDNLKYMQSIEKRWRVNNTIGRLQRCCLANWIVNLNANPGVVQLACWYLDAYLNKTTVPLKRLQLVATACYWISAKINGAYTHVSSRRLERRSLSAFTTAQLTTMERDVLRKLHFPITPVVAYDFIPHMCAWCHDVDGMYKSGAEFIALCVALLPKSGYEYAPSVTAAACVRNVMKLIGHSSSILRLETCPLYKSAVQKTNDFRSVCFMVRESIRTVSSKAFKYRAPFVKYSGAPHYVAVLISEAVNSSNILKEDMRLRSPIKGMYLVV